MEYIANLSHVRPLSDTFTHLPAQAIQGRLADVVSVDGTTNWNQAATDMVKGLIENKQVVVTLRSKEEGKVVVDIADPSGGGGSVSQILVKAGVARGVPAQQAQVQQQWNTGKQQQQQHQKQQQQHQQQQQHYRQQQQQQQQQQQHKQCIITYCFEQLPTKISCQK
jgi:endonuclease YncB( thermonuclease family)